MRRLLIVVAKASLIGTTGCFALAVAAATLMGDEPRIPGMVTGMVAALLPAAFAAWWMFRKLQTQYKRREARSVAITFLLLSPISLGIAMVLAQFPGAYADALLGGHFAAIGAFVGAFVIMTILSCAACAFALSITRQQMQYEGSETKN